MQILLNEKKRLVDEWKRDRTRRMSEELRVENIGDRTESNHTTADHRDLRRREVEKRRLAAWQKQKEDAAAAAALLVEEKSAEENMQRDKLVMKIYLSLASIIELILLLMTDNRKAEAKSFKIAKLA